MHAFIWIGGRRRTYASQSKEKKDSKFNVSVEALVTEKV